MSYNLFYIVPQGENPNVKSPKIAVHAGEYASKDEGLAAYSKLASHWNMALIKGDQHLPEALFQREGVRTVLPVFAAEVQKQIPKLKAVFVTLSAEKAPLFQPTDEGLQAWLSHYGEQWGHTNAPEESHPAETEAPKSLGVVGHIKPDVSPRGNKPSSPAKPYNPNPDNHNGFDVT